MQPRMQARPPNATWTVVAITTLLLIPAIESSRGAASQSGTVDWSLLATIPLSGSPYSGTYDPANGAVYFSTTSTGAHGNLSSVPSGGGSVGANVAVGLNPWPSTYDPANGDLYVPNYFSGTLSVVSSSSNQVVATVPGLSGGPAPPAVDPRSGMLYVSEFSSENLSVVSPITNSITDNVSLGERFVWWPAFDSLNDEVYVIEEGVSGHINMTAVSTDNNQVVAQIPIGNPSYPFLLAGGNSTPALDRANGDIYLSDAATDQVLVISGQTNTIIAKISVGDFPCDPSIDPVTGDVFVSNSFSSNISVISPTSNEVVATIPTGPNPNQPEPLPSLDAMAVPQDNLSGQTTQSSRVTVISVSSLSVSNVFNVGTWPATPTFNPSDGRVYVPCFNSNNVSVLGAPSAPGKGFLGLPGSEGYFLIAASAVLLAAAIVWEARRRRHSASSESSSPETPPTSSYPSPAEPVGNPPDTASTTR